STSQPQSNQTSDVTVVPAVPAPDYSVPLYRGTIQHQRPSILDPTSWDPVLRVFIMVSPLSTNVDSNSTTTAPAPAQQSNSTLQKQPNADVQMTVLTDKVTNTLPYSVSNSTLCLQNSGDGFASKFSIASRHDDATRKTVVVVSGFVTDNNNNTNACTSSVFSSSKSPLYDTVTRFLIDSNGNSGVLDGVDVVGDFEGNQDVDGVNEMEFGLGGDVVYTVGGVDAEGGVFEVPLI
ncbi:hypothetical protein HDU76_009319, partial [Blyttiomyces sp. JEL0837]